MAKQKIEIEVDIPEGYHFVRYGFCSGDESYVGHGGMQIVVAKDAPKYRGVAVSDIGKKIETRDSGGDWGRERVFAGWFKDKVATSDGGGVFYTWDHARILDN